MDSLNTAEARQKLAKILAGKYLWIKKEYNDNMVVKITILSSLIPPDQSYTSNLLSMTLRILKWKCSPGGNSEAWTPPN